MATIVMIVEDDPSIRQPTASILHDEGYVVIECERGEEAIEAMEQHDIACVLLDLMLPGIDGFETTRRLRQRSDVPIIVVTAKDDSFDMVAGLEAGADDYVTKPFVPKVLVARIRAALRRARPTDDGGTATMLGERVEIRSEEGRVVVAGDDVHLTRTEFRLLCELAASPGHVLSRNQLLEAVWGYDYFGETKLVDVHVYRLRAKIEADPSNPVHIATVRGLGYKAVP